MENEPFHAGASKPSHRRNPRVFQRFTGRWPGFCHAAESGKKQKSLLDEKCAIAITLPKNEDRPCIHYFAADRISRIYSEKADVVFSSYTTKAKRLRLRNLTTPGQQWIKQSETLDRAYKFPVPAPAITSTYQLEAWQSEIIDDPEKCCARCVG